MTGGCQCGAVRYAIGAEPLTVYACHCTDCQRQTGAAFALSMVVPRTAIAIVKGAPKRWERPASHTASGTPTTCLFCPDCGNRLYHLPSRNAAIAVVKPGTLDDTRELAIAGHIWTRSAQPWVAIPAHMLCYEGQSPNFDALIDAWAALRQA
jgi:hypothetical protein